MAETNVRTQTQRDVKVKVELVGTIDALKREFTDVYDQAERINRDKPVTAADRALLAVKLASVDGQMLAYAHALSVLRHLSARIEAILEGRD